VIWTPFLLIASWLLTGCYAPLAKRLGLLDHPNHRSAHVVIKPRGAGVVFIALWCLFAGVAAVTQLITWHEFLLFIPATLLISSVSYLDDWLSLRARTRFAVQLLAAILLISLLYPHLQLDFGFIKLTAGYLVIPITLFSILWSTNLYNFMDGSDGVAGVEALFVFGIGAGMLFFAGANGLAILALALCAVILGFLRWNWPDSKVFMGDVGSTALGFLVAAFALAGQSYGIPLTLWLILYGIFWFDATVTLLTRVIRKEKWYEPHKSHAYQRLQQNGLSHSQVLWAMIALNSTLACTACVCYWHRAWLIYGLMETIILLAVSYFVCKKSGEEKQPYN